MPLTRQARSERSLTLIRGLDRWLPKPLSTNLAFRKTASFTDSTRMDGLAASSSSVVGLILGRTEEGYMVHTVRSVGLLNDGHGRLNCRDQMS